MLIDPVAGTRDRRAPAGVRAGRARRRWARRAGRAARLEARSPDGKQRGVHPRLESLGARRGDRPRNAADHRRRQGLRLRHRQRRLDAQRSPDPACGRRTRRRSRPSSRISAASARCISSTPRSAIPTLQAWKYPLPGDAVVTMIQRVVIDVDSRHGRARCRWRRTSIARRCATTWRAAASGATCSGARTDRRSRSCPRRAITSTSSCAWPTRPPARSATSSKRRPKRSSSRATAASTGGTCPASNEVIWFSERDNWGHLYLHDLADGPREARDHERRRQRHAAAARRREEPAAVLRRASGRRTGRDPYFRHLYRIGMDGNEPAAADAGGRRPRRDAVAVRAVLRRQLLEARRAAGRGAARRRRQADPDAREGRHLAAARDRLEAADADHREGARRRRPISTA